MQLLNEVYEANTVREPWQAGDLMLVDNIRTAHSREPFEGPREVLVAMADPVRLADCSPTVEVTADDHRRRIPTEPAPSASRSTVPPFAVISGAQVQQALQGREKQIVELVEATYRLHGAGDSVNPPSYFLRFPDRPSSRIIALPASIGGEVRVDGLKWISSFPENVAAGIPRASAVLILNDHDTGYPFACLESSIISATRTAASAALAADRLSRGRPRPTRVGFFGAGLIARYIHTFLAGTGWSFDEIGVHDLSADSAAGFRGYLEQSGAAGPDHRARQRRAADPLQRPGGLRHRRRRSPTSTTRPGSTTTRWCCTCRCATSRRRSCSPRPTSSTTSSTA